MTKSNVIYLAEKCPNLGAIIFSTSGYKDIIRIEANGDIYVKGKLIENDKELVDGFREFLLLAGFNK